MNKEVYVKKRSGELELLDYDKIHTMLSQCAEGLNVSVSDVALNAHLKIANKMSSVAIQQFWFIRYYRNGSYGRFHRG
jgi:hypothetical protein